MLKRVSAILLCLAITFSFVACNNGKEFTEAQNKAIVSYDGTEYTLVGNEGNVWCFGEREFVGGVAGEKSFYEHLAVRVKTGMYSVGGSQDVLVRRLPDNEFCSIYVRSDLLKAEASLDNCIRFELVKGALADSADFPSSQKAITDCEHFLSEIKDGQTATDAGLYESARQPDGALKNVYVYGYVCGIIQKDVNVVIPLEVISFDDKTYSIKIDNIEYVLSNELLDAMR